MEDLNIRIESLADGKISALHLAGVMDTSNAHLVDRELRALIRQGIHCFLVDLEKVTYISSSGWGAFLSEIPDIKGNGGDIVLHGLSESLQKVHDMMDFSTLLKVFPDAGKAESYLETLCRVSRR